MSAARKQSKDTALDSSDDTTKATASRSQSNEPCRPPSRAEEKFYGAGLEIIAPTSYDELADVVRASTEEKRLIIPAGLGRHAYIGNLPDAGVDAAPLIVSMQHFSDVPRYEPEDFTVGAQAGVRLDHLQDMLAENGQEISIDWTRKSAGTLGGAVAVGLDGPRRASCGTLRGFTIGHVGLRGNGVLYKSGGMVVKNVAGYDVGKLLVGSLGTLGVIVEVNFKLSPLPRARAAQAACFETRDAVESFVSSFRHERLDPTSLSVLAPAATADLAKTIGISLSGWTALSMFEGNAESVGFLERAAKNVSSSGSPSELTALDDTVLTPVRDWITDFETPDDLSSEGLAIVRLSTLPTRVFEVHGALEKIVEAASVSASFLADSLSGVCLARLEGTREELESAIDQLKPLLPGLAGAGGVCNGRLVFASPGIRQRQTYLLNPDPNRALAQRIQDVFDPGQVFHPARVSPTLLH